MLEDELHKYIKDHGIKVAWLSNKTEISYGIISRSLHGKRRLRTNELLLICKTLGISIDELISGKEVSSHVVKEADLELMAEIGG